MKVNIKRLVPEAHIPVYAKNGDAGLDLIATSRDSEDGFIEYGTGLAIEIPEGHVGLLFPRSSITKKGIMLKNSVGVIDSGYRGEIKLRFHPLIKEFWKGFTYDIGDKVGQLIIMPIPRIELQEVQELSNSERGDGGFGSTDTITNENKDNVSK